jgi:hypothetical protein
MFNELVEFKWIVAGKFLVNEEQDLILKAISLKDDGYVCENWV